MDVECAAPAPRGQSRLMKGPRPVTNFLLVTIILTLLSAGTAHAVVQYPTPWSSFSLSAGAGIQDSGGSTPQMKQAAKWASSQIRSADPTWSEHFHHPWSGYCEAFVSQAEGYMVGFDSALAAYRWQLSHGRVHTDSNPPVGALVYYAGGAYGHVAVSIGDGQEVGTLGNAGQRLRVQQYPVRGFLTSTYLGWAKPMGS